MNKNNKYVQIALVMVLVLLLNYAGQQMYHRFDLTQDKRYTMSDETRQVLENLEKPVNIKVYLQGDFPSEFRRLQEETIQFLQEISAINEDVRFRFIDPLSSAKELVKKGLMPSRLTVQEGGKVSEAVIFPWALVSYDGKEEKVSLLINSVSGSQEEQLQRSIENLEYEFTQSLAKVSREKSKKIAVLKGNGELSDLQLYSFLSKLGEFYHLAAFTLDSVESDAPGTLEQLSTYDLALIAKPTEPFSEEEKYVLDQFVMRGGKTAWFIDQVHAEMDSLMDTGKTMVFNRDLRLTDLFFNYGFRINYNIGKDLYSSTIRLASGNTGNQVQYQDFLWPYFPLVFPSNDHPVSRSIDPVLLRFPSGIDTLSNGLAKSVLLHSSPKGRLIGAPVDVSLDEIAREVDKEGFNDPFIPFGLMIEGEFRSAYQARIKPFQLPNAKEGSESNKMLVVSDGDILSNEVSRGEPLPLDKDKWTGQPYGNLDFLLNGMHYLLDEGGIIQLRSKSIQLQFLDKEKAFEERVKWQLINLVLPILLLMALGFSFRYFRQRRYT